MGRKPKPLTKEYEPDPDGRHYVLTSKTTEYNDYTGEPTTYFSVVGVYHSGEGADDWLEYFATGNKYTDYEIEVL